MALSKYEQAVQDGIQQGRLNRANDEYQQAVNDGLNGKYDFGVDADYINSFIADSQNYLTSAENDDKTLGYGNAGEVASSRRKQWADLDNRRMLIQAYVNSHKSAMDKDQYEQINSYLNSYEKGSSYILNYFDGKQKFYSQWETENDYNKYIADWLNPEGETDAEKVSSRKAIYDSNNARIAEIDKEIEEAKKNKTIKSVKRTGASSRGRGVLRVVYEYEDEVNALEKEKAALEAENRQYDRTQKDLDSYYYLQENDDFDTVSSNRDLINPTKEELWENDIALDSTQWYWENGKMYDVLGNEIDTTHTDSKGNIIHPLEDKVKITDKLGLYLNSSDAEKEEAYADFGTFKSSWHSVLREGEDSSWEELREDEIKTYYYLMNTQGQDAAYKFLDDLTTELNRRSTNKMETKISKADALEKIALNIASVPANVLGGVTGLIDDAINTIQGKDINPYSKAHGMSNFANATRAYTAEDLNNLTGNASFLTIKLGDVYQSVMSGVDSFIAGGMFGATGASILLGTNAATSEAKRLYEEGASASQVAWGGLLSGAAEMVFEKISLDRLLDPNITSKTKLQIIKNALLQGGVEASEEAFTEIANKISDLAVRGSQSDTSKLIDSYIAEGKSQGEATFLALVNAAGDVWKSAVGGFISGFGMGGVQQTANYARYNSAAEQTGQRIINDGGYNALRQLADDVAGSKGINSGLVNKFAKAADKKQSAKNVGKLSDAVETARVNQNKADIVSALREKGLSKKQANQIAQYMNDTIDGVELSETDQENLENILSNNDDVADVWIDIIGKDSDSHTINKRNLQHNLDRKGLAETVNGIEATDVFKNAGETAQKYIGSDIQQPETTGGTVAETGSVQKDNSSGAGDGFTSIDPVVSAAEEQQGVQTFSGKTQLINNGFNTVSNNQPSKHPNAIEASPELQRIIDRLADDESISDDEINSVPQIAEAIQESKSIPETYTIDTPERNRMRKSIVDYLLDLGSYSGVDENGNSVYNGNVNQEHRIDIVVGPPAAGKSSVLVEPLSQRYQSRVIDSDMAKELLPEFEGGIGANAVHRESQDILKDVIIESVQNGDNIVYPIVGGGKVENLLNKINRFKENGYSVYLHLNELPINKAAGRALNRYILTGRFIPPSIILEYGDTPVRNFEKIISMEGIVDGYSHWSNDVTKGQQPIRIKESEDFQLLFGRGQRSNGLFNRVDNKAQGTKTETKAGLNDSAFSNAEDTAFDEPDLTDTSGMDPYERVVRRMNGEQFDRTPQHERVEKVAEKLGRKLYWDCKFGDGYIDSDGNIHLAPDTDDPLFKVFKHDLTHYLEKNERLYNLFANAVMDSQVFKDWVKSKGYNSTAEFAEAKKALYEEAEKERQRTNPEAPQVKCDNPDAEILADFVGENLFGGEHGLTDKLMGEMEEKPRRSFFEAVKDWFAKIKRAMLGTKEIKTIEQAEDAFIRTYKAVQKSVEKGKTGSSVKYSYAGVNARTADNSLLLKAQSMLDNGADSETVRKETGWFKGYDSKWRFEIDDSSLRLDDKKIKVHYDRYGDVDYRTAKLSDIIDGTKLLEAYPELKNITVIIQETNSGTLGSYFQKDKHIVVSQELFKRLTDEYKAYQNSKQSRIKEIEATDEYKKYNKFFESDYLEDNPVEWLRQSKAAQAEFYNSDLGKEYHELKWGKENGVNKYEIGWSDEARSVLIHEIQHAVQDIEGFATGSNGKNKDYYRVAGEIESRDVEKRLNYTAEQRKSTRPDIDRTDVVFADGGVAYYSAEESNNSSIKQQLREHLNEVNAMSPVAEVQYAPTNKKNLRAQAVQEFKKIGYKVERQGFGIIEIGDKQIEKSLEYITTDGERAALLVVPKVLKRGIEISGHKDHKGRSYETITIAAPVSINGKIGDVAVVVKVTGKNRYSTHRILMPDGSEFVFEENKNTEPTSSDMLAKKSDQGTDISSVSDTTVSQKEQSVNSQYMQEGENNSSDLDTNSESGDSSPESENKVSYSIPSKTAADLLEQYEQGKITKEEYLSRITKQKTDSPGEIAHLTPEDASTTPTAPEVTDNGVLNGESSFYTNAKEKSKFVNETVKQLITDDKFIKNYAAITNRETLQAAAEKLNEGGKRFVDEWFAKPPQDMTAEDISVGLILIERYQTAGDSASAVNVMRQLRQAGTKAGQTVQAFSMLGRLDPTTMQMYMQKELDEAYEEMVKGRTQKWIDENQSKFELTEEEMDYIRRRTLQAANATDKRTKDIAIAEILAMVSNKIPPEKGRALKALMRINMLFNLKTQVRNILGNAGMVVPFFASDLVGSVIDRVIARKTGYRAKGSRFITLKNFSAFGRGVKESWEDYRLGIDTRQELDRFDIGQGKSFNDQHTGVARIKNPISRVLNRIDRFNSFLLDVGDRPFFEYWFTNSLENQMRLNDVTEPTADMLEIAEQEALTRVWQDNNRFTNAVSNFKRTLNTLNIGGYGLGDVYIKFVKTPANLVKAMVDFSPVGLMRGFHDAHALKNAMQTGHGNISLMQHQAVKSLSNGIVGTLMYICFIALAKGAFGAVINGAPDDDDDVDAFNREVLGKYPYTITFGDISIAYDWMSPVGSMVIAASAIVDSIEEGGDVITVIKNSVKSAAQVLFDQSFMQSFKNVFANNDGIVSGLTETILDEPAILIPQIMAQLASMLDGKSREAYQKNDTWQSLLNDVMYKIPGLRNMLEPKLDALGREVNNPRDDFFNAFVNPANTYSAISTETADEIYRLYESTGESSVVYPKAPRTVTKDKVTYTLTIKERNQYQTTLGKTADGNIANLMKLGAYKEMTDDQRVEVIEDIYDYAKKVAKAEYFNDSEMLEGKYRKMKILEDEGVISAAEYLMLTETGDTDDNGYLNEKELNAVLKKYIEDQKARKFVKELFKANNADVDKIAEKYTN